jgi:hypothetical protein
MVSFAIVLSESTDGRSDFNTDDLPGAFAVWAASKEAEFLHGRYVFASWVSY